MESAIDSRQLKTGDSFEITLKSRGALGLQLLYKIMPSEIATVSRLKTESDQQPQPGDAIEAVYRIEGIKTGDCLITFYETQPWNKDFKPIIRQEIHLKVRDKK